MRIEGLGVEHHRGRVQLPDALEKLQVMGEGEVGGDDKIRLFPLQVLDKSRENGDSQDPVDDLDHERIVCPAIEGVDQGRIAQGAVPVEAVDVAKEVCAKDKAQVHDVDLDVFVAQEVELLLYRDRRSDMPPADIDCVEIDVLLHAPKSVDPVQKRCQRDAAGLAARCRLDESGLFSDSVCKALTETSKRMLRSRERVPRG